MEAIMNKKTIIEYSPRTAVAKEIEFVWEKISVLTTKSLLNVFLKQRK